MADTKISALNALTGANVDPAADVLAIVDTGAGETKKILVNQLSSGLITLAADQATTSGTEFDFTGIPAGVKRITMIFSEISLSGTDNLLVQLGDAGGPETGTYVSTSGAVINAAAAVTGASTTGFVMLVGGAGAVVSGTMVINLIDSASFHWVASHSAKVATTTTIGGGGDKSLSAELTQIRLTRSGTDTFDAGAVTITYG